MFSDKKYGRIFKLFENYCCNVDEKTFGEVKCAATRYYHCTSINYMYVHYVQFVLYWLNHIGYISYI